MLCSRSEVFRIMFDTVSLSMPKVASGSDRYSPAAALVMSRYRLLSLSFRHAASVFSAKKMSLSSHSLRFL